jgi:hypothetical protein
VCTIINSPLHKIGQGVLQDGLENFLFDLGDMRRSTLKIKEDIEFQRGLIVKLNWRNFSSLEFAMYSFGLLKQILKDLNKFCRFAQL